MRRHEVGGLVCTCVLLARLNLRVGHAILCIVWLGNTLWYLQVGILNQQNMDVHNSILQTEPQEFFRMYLAHHELESGFIVTVINLSQHSIQNHRQSHYMRRSGKH